MSRRAVIAGSVLDRGFARVYNSGRRSETSSTAAHALQGTHAVARLLLHIVSTPRGRIPGAVSWDSTQPSTCVEPPPPHRTPFVDPDLLSDSPTTSNGAALQETSPDDKHPYSTLANELKTISEEIDSMLGYHEPGPEPLDPVPEELQPMLEQMEAEENKNRIIQPQSGLVLPEQFSFGPFQLFPQNEGQINPVVPTVRAYDEQYGESEMEAEHVRSAIGELCQAMSSAAPQVEPYANYDAASELDLFSACQPSSSYVPYQQELQPQAAMSLMGMPQMAMSHMPMPQTDMSQMVMRPPPPPSANSTPTLRRLLAPTKRSHAPPVPPFEQPRGDASSVPHSTKRVCRRPSDSEDDPDFWLTQL